MENGPQDIGTPQQLLSHDGKVTGPAFQGACRPEPVTFLQLLQLKEYVANRFDEVMATCCAGGVLAAQQPVPSDKCDLSSHEQLLQDMVRNSEATAGELSQLKRQMYGLEQLLVRHLVSNAPPPSTFNKAANGDGERVQGISGMFQRTSSTSELLRLESKLEAMQFSYTARFDELKQICNEVCESSKQSDERLQNMQSSMIDLDQQMATGMKPEVSRKSSVRRGGSSISVDSAFSNLSAEEQRQIARVAGAWRGNAALEQVLGWTIQESEADMLTPRMDPAVSKCLGYVKVMSAILRVVNAIWLGLSLHISMDLLWQGRGLSGWIRHVDIAFLVAFILELLAQIALEKCRFFRGKDAWWNIIDAILTILLFLEIVVVVQQGIVGALRCIRLVRALGTLRTLFLFQRFRSLRLFVRSLITILMPLACTCLFLLMVLYMGSLGITQMVYNHITEKHPGLSASVPDDKMRSLYGSIWASMFTLLAAVIGNSDWLDLVQPLSAISPSAVLVFWITAAFGTAGIGNLLVGIFVERIVNDGHEDDRLHLREALATKQSSIGQLREVLQAKAVQTNGVMSRRLAVKAIEGPGLEHVQSMGIELQTALGVLDMLDTQNNGFVNLDEYLTSLSQLMAENVSVLMATTMYESRRLEQQIRVIQQQLSDFMYMEAAAASDENPDGRTSIVSLFPR